VAIVTRDHLLVTGSKDPEGLAKFKEMAQDAYGADAGKRLRAGTEAVYSRSRYADATAVLFS